MRSSGTRKKSPSQMVTGESRPANLNVQPRPSLPMLGALYRGEEGGVRAGRSPDVLDDLQRRLVRRVVVRVVGECRACLGAEDVVYELVGVVRVLGALGYAHVVRPAGRRGLRDDVVEILVGGKG